MVLVSGVGGRRGLWIFVFYRIYETVRTIVRFSEKLTSYLPKYGSIVVHLLLLFYLSAQFS